MPEGKHSYRLSLDLYSPQAGMVELISGQERKVIDLVLKPNFGTLVLNSTPESGASVLLDGMPTGKTTPCTLERIPTGDHIVSLSLNDYATTRSQITMLPDSTREITIPMEPSFALAKLYTDSLSDVLVNGQSKGAGFWSGRLVPGVYTFIARKPSHVDAVEQRSLSAGQEVEVSLHPRPVYGTLKVITNPFDALVIIDGEAKGKSPITLEQILIGKHQVELVREGFTTVRKELIIEESEVSVVEETLSNYREVVVESNPTGARLELNGHKEGITPKTVTLPYGSNSIQLEAPGYVKLSESFRVSEGQRTYTFNLMSDNAAKAGIRFKKYRRGKVISLITGAAFAGAGTFFYLQSEKHFDEYQTATTNATDLHNQVENEQLMSKVFFGVSGACFTSAVVFHFLQRKAGKEMTVSVAPTTHSMIIGLTLNI